MLCMKEETTTMENKRYRGKKGSTQLQQCFGGKKETTTTTKGDTEVKKSREL